MVQVLLDRGAGIEMKNCNRKAALGNSIELMRKDNMRISVKSRAPVTIQQKNGSRTYRNVIQTSGNPPQTWKVSH